MTQQDNRRDLLKAGVQIGCAGALAALCGPVGPLFADEPDVEPAALAAERERRKWRRRRLIMNNDGCDAMVAGADTLEGFLSQQDRPILNSQVDSMFYCTGSRRFPSRKSARGRGEAEDRSPKTGYLLHGLNGLRHFRTPRLVYNDERRTTNDE